MSKLTTSISMSLVRYHVEKLVIVSMCREGEVQDTYTCSVPTIEGLLAYCPLLSVDGDVVTSLRGSSCIQFGRNIKVRDDGCGHHESHVRTKQAPEVGKCYREINKHGDNLETDCFKQICHRSATMYSLAEV
jgi:hypothetical protein